MKKTLLLLLLTFFCMPFFSQRNFVATKDVFGTRVFIENKGQFKSPLNSGDNVKFVFEEPGAAIYFTEKGLVYRLHESNGGDEEAFEAMEKGKKPRLPKEKECIIGMEWLNGTASEIISEQKQKYYFTYGAPDLNSYGYKKLTYKNVYKNIDIEYIIPEDKENGIKYNIILWPGANPNDIRIAYSGDMSKIAEREGNIIIKNRINNIMEHQPAAFSDSQKLNCSFRLDNGIIGFDFPSGFPAGQKVTIDPWVTTLAGLTTNSSGYDVDMDDYGNLFVWGGTGYYKVAKYDPAGNLLWVFSGNIPAAPWNTSFTCGNFVVHRSSGKTYIGQGAQGGGSVIARLDQAGNWDNFLSTPYNSWLETWELGYHCSSGKIYGLGGGTTSWCSGGLIDQITGTVNPSGFLANPSPCCNDIACSAIDDAGNVFVYYAESAFMPYLANNNRIVKINPAFNGSVWEAPSTYNTFSEITGKNNYNPPLNASNGFNCITVNNSYLFFYDGLNVAAYDKNNGTKLGFTTVPGGVVKVRGGIAVDDCNNVYVGGNGNIMSFSFNGTSFTPLTSISLGVNTPVQDVYDIRLNRVTNQLYVSGSGFAGTYSAINSNNCLTTQFQVNTSCQGFNNGSAVITVTTNIGNPAINYIWTSGNSTVSATMGSSLTTNTVVSLPSGTYAVLVQINAPCGPAFINTVNVICCTTASISATATQVGCTFTQNAVSLSIAGGGTVNPSITWTPAPMTVAGNSLSASGLPAGITTVIVAYPGNCVSTLTVSMLPAPPPVTFTLNNLSGSGVINCLTPSINLQAVSNYSFGSLSYSWTSLTFTSGASSVTVTQPNTMTVTAFDPATGCTATSTIAITINTTAPTNTVNPANQVITCNSGSPVTFTGTALSPTVNIQHDWYSPVNPFPAGPPIVSSNNTITLLNVIPYGPGIYTLVTTDLVNGCKTAKTITVTSLSAWPTFSVNSPTNYSIGCAPLNQTTISIINPVSTQTPPATCSYTFLPPTFTGAVTPSVILGGFTSTTTTIPGTWTLIVQDNSNFCRSQITIPIIQNTIAPNVSANVLTQTLTCYHPTVLATGSSTTSNTEISWLMPVSPPNLPSPTVVVGMQPTGPNTSTSSLNYASYTVVATNSINACQSSSVVIFNQNFKPPVSSPTISIATPTAIYCIASQSPVVLTTGNSTTTSGGGPTAFVVNACWAGPSPQTPTCGPSTYSCYVPGVYSLTVMDNYNGCTTTATINVIDKSQLPVLTNPVSTGTVDCGGTQATLLTSIVGSSTGLMYWYFLYPTGAAFSPTAAPVSNINPLLSGTPSNSVNVSLPGLYQFLVSNTLTGCQVTGMFNVTTGGLLSDFTPNPQNGYAPLDVVFTNNSSSTLESSSITSVWSFGNGTSTTTTANINTSATYTAPGTYTVMLISQKGTCMDTTYKVIKVDQPSKLEVPNVFTPNGDGSNDVFFLKVANMGEIHAIIFDRWGNRVYETTSNSGNILWDGKNLSGKDCSDGVYFYIITGNGKDDKHYEQKGNVSIYR